MKCPYCSCQEFHVTDKRDSGEEIRRRRECLSCKKRFTTYERIKKKEIFVVKSNGKRERFEREKLERGVMKAFEKRDVSKEVIDRMIEEVEENLRKRGKNIIETKIIGNVIMRKIKKIDDVAYIRFASVYLDFKNVEDFKRELKKIEE